MNLKTHEGNKKPEKLANEFSPKSRITEETLKLSLHTHQ